MVEGKEKHGSLDGARVMEGRRRWVIIAVSAALVVIALMLCARCSAPRGVDEGIRIIPRGSMSAAEAQQMLDEQVEASRITVSLSPQPELQDGRLRVNFAVIEPNNGISERLEIEQDGRVVYRTGTVAPGYVVEWGNAPDAHAGAAVATVYAVHESGADFGNPVSVEIEIVE